MGFIRFLLAVSIIFGHIPISNKLFLGAPMALHLFFMVSGFSISYVLQTKYVKAKNGMKNYIISRIVKIYPLYLIILFATVGLAVFEAMRGQTANPLYVLHQFGSHIGLIFSALLTNVAILGQDLSMFASYSVSSNHFFWTNSFISEAFRLDRFFFIPQAWALALELYFYILAPWFMKRSTKLLIIIVIFSLGFRIWLSTQGLPFDPWMYRFFPTELLFFLLGMLAYRSAPYFQALYNHLNMDICFVILLISIIFFRSLPYIEFHGYQVFEWMFYPIFFLLMPYLFSQNRFKGIQTQLGNLSYPMYLSHLFVGAIILRLHLVYPYYGLVTLCTTIGVSFILNIFIQKNLNKWKAWLFSFGMRKHKRIN